LALQLFLAGAASAVPYQVTIDTTALSGAAAQLAFDFVDGGSPANTVVISGFTTDGTLGLSSTVGGVVGTLPGSLSLTDTAFFNEYLTDITLGTSISFVFTPTQNAPDPGSLPDAFSMFLLDPTTGLSLFGTTDPTLADALFQFDIDGTAAGALSAYSVPLQLAGVTVTPVEQGVPLSGTPWLMLAGGLALLTMRTSQRRRLTRR
jgi:hypothetical protein